jgi:hypothetical protein
MQLSTVVHFLLHGLARVVTLVSVYIITAIFFFRVETGKFGRVRDSLNTFSLDSVTTPKALTLCILLAAVLMVSDILLGH